MSDFIEGIDCEQSTLFSERLEDWIGEDNPFRAIDAFVEALQQSRKNLASGGPENGSTANERLLYAEVADAWDAWFHLAKLDARMLPAGPRLPHCELSLSAAERGQGVSLAYDAMARSAIREGKLVRLFDIEVPAVTMYSVAYSASRKRCPDIQVLRDWMFEEVIAEGTFDKQSLPCDKQSDEIQNV